jgi:hypothetical protein
VTDDVSEQGTEGNIVILAQEMCQWWDLVNVITDLREPKNEGNFLTASAAIDLAEFTRCLVTCSIYQNMSVDSKQAYMYIKLQLDS